MQNLIKILAGAQLGKAAGALVGKNPILRSGAASVAARLAMRSLPVSLALLGAGLAYRHLQGKAASGRADKAPQGKAKAARPARRSKSVSRHAKAIPVT